MSFSAPERTWRGPPVGPVFAADFTAGGIPSGQGLAQQRWRKGG